MPAALASLWPVLRPVVEPIIKVIVGLLWEKLNAPDTLEDSRPDPALESALLERVRNARRKGQVN